MSDLETALRSGPADAHPLPDLGPAAARAGLLDVAYAVHDAPVGRLLLAATPAGLVRVAYVDERSLEGALETLARSVSPRVLALPARLDPARRELEEYFAGRRRRFEVAVDWQLVRGFGRRVLEAAVAVPYGATATYREVAGVAGNPRASRAAGNALGANPLPIVIPCHRILRTGGGLGGYTGGLERKRALLALERGGELPLAYGEGPPAPASDSPAPVAGSPGAVARSPAPTVCPPRTPGERP